MNMKYQIWQAFLTLNSIQQPFLYTYIKTTKGAQQFTNHFTSKKYNSHNFKSNSQGAINLVVQKNDVLKFCG